MALRQDWEEKGNIFKIVGGCGMFTFYIYIKGNKIYLKCLKIT